MTGLKFYEIEFKGERYLFLATPQMSGGVYTFEDYSAGDARGSFFIKPNGKVKQFGKVVGRAKDWKVIREVDKSELKFKPGAIARIQAMEREAELLYPEGLAEADRRLREEMKIPEKH